MRKGLFGLALGVTALMAGCATAPERAQEAAVLEAEVAEALSLFKEQYPVTQAYLEKSYGYAVLPRVFKGAFWVGGAYGKGIVYEQGEKVGYCSLSQATLGLSFGGEFFREVIFFADWTALDRFRSGQFAFSAQATAVAATTGAAAKADYRDGMAVLVMTDAGLMVDASIGGQSFKYIGAPQ
ncbi:MAG TPA: hypothetical protein ENN87_11840 [Phycisphaerales bacterium]|nr:hypothetical protein [Phycisphaerales bacterium]